jgi:hypothetical protein
MRTTVDIKPEHRDALLARAPRRGEKGFSSVLAEAIEEYLDEEKRGVRRRKELLSLAGVLSAKEARSFRGAATSLRENWR